MRPRMAAGRCVVFRDHLPANRKVGGFFVGRMVSFLAQLGSIVGPRGCRPRSESDM